MEILLLDELMPDAIAWLEARHSTRYPPELADDLVVWRKVVYKTKAILFPRQTGVTQVFLNFLPRIKAVCRLHVGTDNSDLKACSARGITVIHASSADLRSNAGDLTQNSCSARCYCCIAAVWSSHGWGATLPRRCLAGSCMTARWRFWALHPPPTP